MKKLIAIIAVSLCFWNPASAATIFIVGDSTASIKPDHDRPETGWGEALPALVAEPHTVNNVAVNGRSTRSFMTEGRWQAVLNQLQPEDLVLIQFGHNDQKYTDYRRFADPWRDYPLFLRQYVEDTVKKGAYPVLLSSIARRRFDAEVPVNTHAPYPESMEQVAAILKVPYVDMNSVSSAWLTSLGTVKSKAFYLHVDPGTNPNYPDGISDDTHLNAAGANEIAAMIARQIKALGSPYAEHFL